MTSQLTGFTSADRPVYDSTVVITTLPVFSTSLIKTRSKSYISVYIHGTITVYSVVTSVTTGVITLCYYTYVPNTYKNIGQL